jgi:hypothetical protein
MDEKKRVKTMDVVPRPGEMIKPGEIIGIPGMEGWSLADRRTWNLLLVNAWSDRLEDPTADFQIALHELRGLHDSNDRVRASLEKLQTTLIAARMPDGKSRTVQMLGACDIDDDERVDGQLRYDFHHKLVPLLRRSEIYARMEMKIISSFGSKYALALYEALALRINLHRSIEEISIETLRHWLGVENGKLDRYPDLNRFAIKPAVQEVNALSPFMVTVEPIKRGKKVASVRLTWAKKEPFSPNEQAAAREVNRHRAGRVARITGKVESLVRELSPEQIQKGYDAAAATTGQRIDKHSAHADWLAMVRGFPTPPENPVGHFIEFCRKRARSIA